MLTTCEGANWGSRLSNSCRMAEAMESGSPLVRITQLNGSRLAPSLVSLALRNIHHGYHSTRQPTLRHAANNAHNLTHPFVKVGAESLGDLHTVPDGILVRPILPSERFVDDHYMGRVSSIGASEIATAHKRNAQRLEITGGNKPPVLVALPFFPALRCMPLDTEWQVDAHLVHRQRDCAARNAHTGQGLDAFRCLPHHVFHLGCAAVTASGNRAPQSEHIGRIDSRFDRAQTGERANHQSSSSEQYHRERDLTDHQQSPNTAVLESRAGTAARFLQHRIHVEARHAQRGKEPEQQAGGKRYAKQKHQYPPIEQHQPAQGMFRSVDARNVPGA